VTFGTWRPSIVLPDEARQWPREDLERALVHEMEHVRRCDWAVHVAARLVCAMYWFHPLVWIAWRRLHVEADRACDDAVASRPDGDAFARQLVTLAERISSSAALPIPAMARPGNLSIRVRSLLDANQARGRAGRAWTAAAAVLCATSAGLVAPLVAVEGRADDRAVQTPIELPAERFAKVSITRSSYPEDVSDPLQRLRRSPAFQVYGQQDTLRATNATLEDLLRWAHGVGQARLARPDEAIRPWSVVEGVPEWNDLFDVNAQSRGPLPETPPGTVGPIHLMMQALLADRFGVLVHWEPRSRPYYVLARTGSLGPQIRPTDCATSREVFHRSGEPSRTPPEVIQRSRDLLASARAIPCTNMTMSADEAHPDGVRGQREIAARRRSLDDLAAALERELGVQVMNGTGLEGGFDIDLRYFRDPATEAQALSLRHGTRWRFWQIPLEPQQVPDAQWPPLDVALREQLGLELQQRDTIEEVLVVDRAELPVLDQP
jgi:uncharacterized protein (TIGR03435 family)